MTLDVLLSYLKAALLVPDDTKRLKEFPYDKIGQRKKRIHPEHSPRFIHDIQLEIDCYDWAIGKIDVNKIPFDRLERIIRQKRV